MEPTEDVAVVLQSRRMPQRQLNSLMGKLLQGFFITPKKDVGNTSSKIECTYASLSMK